jgi:hypothetical protein
MLRPPILHSSPLSVRPTHRAVSVGVSAEMTVYGEMSDLWTPENIMGVLMLSAIGGFVCFMVWLHGEVSVDDYPARGRALLLDPPARCRGPARFSQCRCPALSCRWTPRCRRPSRSWRCRHPGNRNTAVRSAMTRQMASTGALQRSLPGS